MMNKMKMEDKERKDAHQKFEEEQRQRNREMGLPEPLMPAEAVHDDDEHAAQHVHFGRGPGHHRGRGGDQRGRGPQRGRGRGHRGGPGGQFGGGAPGVIPSMLGVNPTSLASNIPGMFIPPPGMPGFPGMEQLIMGGGPGGFPGFNPGNFSGNQNPLFHPLGAGIPPGQFGNQFRFPGIGRGLGRGFMPGGGRGYSAIGRGAGRGRGGRGGAQHKPNIDRNVINAEQDGKSLDAGAAGDAENEEKAEETNAASLEDLEVGNKPQPNNVTTSEQNGEKPDVAASNDEPPKNVISGQVIDN